MTAKERKRPLFKKRLGSSAVVDFALPQHSSRRRRPTPASESANGCEARSGSDRPGEPPPSEWASTEKKTKYPWNSYTGKLYHLFAGIPIATILTNRSGGEFTGPVNLMVTTRCLFARSPACAHPSGTRVLGEAKRVEVSGQRRLVCDASPHDHGRWLLGRSRRSARARPARRGGAERESEFSLGQSHSDRGRGGSHRRLISDRQHEYVFGTRRHAARSYPAKRPIGNADS